MRGRFAKLHKDIGRIGRIIRILLVSWASVALAGLPCLLAVSFGTSAICIIAPRFIDHLIHDGLAGALPGIVVNGLL